MEKQPTPSGISRPCPGSAENPELRATSLRILAIEPYWGGSHRAFLDGWREDSRHAFTLLTLPPHKWKWRMRHAAWTAAREADERARGGASWDVVFASAMLDLAQFRGLAPAAVGRLPAVAYFHENQLTHPVRHENERDLHFAFTHLTTGLAADAVWFNSVFHRDEFLTALERLVARMPDHQPRDAVEEIRARTAVHWPGVGEIGPRLPRYGRPMTILWAARWEFDKNPEDFFAALELLRARGVEFRLNVLGESFRSVPEIFARARQTFAAEIVRWGYQPSRADYESALLESDVVVSTAHHEFFGISVVEAIAAGCFPLLPDRLSYPELLAEVPPEQRGDFFYGGTVDELAERLAGLAGRFAAGDPWRGDPALARRSVRRFAWSEARPRLDDALEAVQRGSVRQPST